MGALAAGLAAAGAMAGGLAMYGWSARDPQAARAAVAAVPAVSDAMIADADRAMRDKGWFRAALEGPTTSTPYKVYAMLAPGQGVAPLPWAAAAFPVRLPRFLLVAIGFALLGRLIGERVSRPAALGVFTLGWLVFYGWFWWSHPG
ncbi:hypothetical protein [Caulobacter mirabilis]|nr:hypothetical protein [Caulobacter mirabilis]